MCLMFFLLQTIMGGKQISATTKLKKVKWIMMVKCVKQTVHSGMDFKASEKDKIALNAQDVQSRSMSSLQTCLYQLHVD